MQADFATRPDTPVIGLQIHTTPLSPDIPALWPRFVARIPEIAQQAAPGVTYGVMGHAVNDMATLDYVAGVAVRDAAGVPPGMTRIVIPGGTYALFRCPLDKLPAGFAEIFDQWLPTSAFTLRPGPCFERYDETFDPTQSGSLVEIGIPVAPRTGR